VHSYASVTHQAAEAAINQLGDTASDVKIASLIGCCFSYLMLDICM